MKHDHHRQKIVSAFQHLYEHDLSELPYSHQSLPNTVTNAEQAMNYIFNILYPQNKTSVATPADLPTGVDTPNIGDVTPTLNDQRTVQDDGDGNAALYIWAKWDGQNAPQWNKIADFDWGINNVITALQDQTQYLYVRKFGITDYDPTTELPLAGDLAGQHIYGGDLANQHLTLHANNGDDIGVHTGFVQFDDDVRPLVDLTYDFGEADKRWQTGYFGTLVIGTATLTITSDATQATISDTSGLISFSDENLITTGDADASTVTGSTALRAGGVGTYLVIAPGSITDLSGSISFGDENLSSTGTLASGVHTVDSTLVLGSGSITDSTGAISFGDENLSTTGTLGAGVATFTQLNIDSLRLDGNTVSSTAGQLILESASDILIQNSSNILLQANDITGVAGSEITAESFFTLGANRLQITGNNITSDGSEIEFGDDLVPSLDNGMDLGGTGKRFQDIWLSGNIENDTNSLTVANLMRMRSANFRDAAMTLPAQAGDALFYDGSVWLASVPDTEIDHGALTGILDDDHTQYLLLAGRAGGQTVHGSNLTGETLTLLNNSADTAGLVLTTSIDPTADASLDLGKAGSRYKDLYMSGQVIGGRVQNVLNAGVAGLFNAAEEGRMLWTTDSDDLYINDGSAFRKVGKTSYNQIKTDVELFAGVVVNTGLPNDIDPINSIWQISDTATNEVLGVGIEKTGTTVTVIADTGLLPAGNYRLMGIEV